MSVKIYAMSCILLSTVLVACEGPFSDYKNYDLKVEHQKCETEDFSAGGAQRCNNIQEECDRRQEETGFRC